MSVSDRVSETQAQWDVRKTGNGEFVLAPISLSSDLTLNWPCIAQSKVCLSND